MKIGPYSPEDLLVLLDGGRARLKKKKKLHFEAKTVITQYPSEPSLPIEFQISLSLPLSWYPDMKP